MKFVKDSFEYIPQEPTLEGALKMIELAARTCYKTEDLITKDSYDRIINNVLIPRGHTSPLEFGTIYLYRSINLHDNYDIVFVEWIKKYLKDRFSRVKEVEDENGTVHFYITTTYRTILQGDYTNPIEAIQNKFDKDWKDDLKYWCEPTEFHHKRYCYKFVMDRGGSQSVERHRGVWGISYAQESTRYCNYNKDKFGKEISVIKPVNIKEGTKEYEEWLKAMNEAEKSYFTLIEDGCKPQVARSVLPTCTKTEIMVTMNMREWRHFIKLRSSSAAHPDIRVLAIDLLNQFKEKIPVIFDDIEVEV